MDELIQLVAQRAGISLDQSARAVSCVISYLTARLPSPVVGRIHEQLGSVNGTAEASHGDGAVE